MDAFRSIPPSNMMAGSEPRVTTSNIGMMHKPSREAKMRGLNRLFYSMVTNSRTSDDIEIDMLSNLHKDHWFKGIKGKNKLEDEE